MERGKRKDIKPADQTALASRTGSTDKQDGAATNGGHFCACGAWLGSLGLEPTMDCNGAFTGVECSGCFVCHLVQVFREVRRVLRDDGVCFMNLGDSYGSGTRAKRDYSKTTKHGYWNNSAIDKRLPGPAKQLMGMPWRVALALQADGWILRSDIVWQKPNPIPESCADRPTRAHEYIFLLAKRQRYYFDHEAIKEPATSSTIKRLSQASFDMQTGGAKDYGIPLPDHYKGSLPGRQDGPGQDRRSKRPRTDKQEQEAQTPVSGWATGMGSHDVIEHNQGPRDGHRTNANRSARKALCNLKERLVAQEKWGDRHAGYAERAQSPSGLMRNKRDVWTISTEPSTIEHYATYPKALVRPCILAGTSQAGACPCCGAPWARVTKRTRSWKDTACTTAQRYGPGTGTDAGRRRYRASHGGMSRNDYHMIGWTPTCKCNATDPSVPCVVLDPFSGTATTGVVALSLGRHYIGIELSEQYNTYAEARLRKAEQEYLDSIAQQTLPL